jgi:hypothetical protein
MKNSKNGYIIHAFKSVLRELRVLRGEAWGEIVLPVCIFRDAALSSLRPPFLNSMSAMHGEIILE